MTPRCTVYIAVTVDGFIARPDGGIDWLENPDFASPEPTGLSYDDFIATVDGLVMGRNTFEKVLTFGGWPYEGTPVVVLSSGRVDVPQDLQGKVTSEGGPPREIVERLADRGMRHLYVDGGVTVQRFLTDRLIDELILTRIPVLVGEGLPLFGPIGFDVPLEHVDTVSGPNGFVQSRYRPRYG